VITRRSPLFWGPAAIGGLGYGLALARTLFEADPLRFATGGGFLLTVATTALCLGLTIGVTLRWGDARTCAAFFPLWLAWIHVLAPINDVNMPRGVVLLIGAPVLAALLWRGPEKESREHPAEAFIVGGISLLVYLLTLQRTIGRADTFEFQVTAPVLGVAHPTGYPLYILLGKLFSLLPIGLVAARVNAASAVFAAIAAGVVFLSARRWLGLDRVIAGLAALGFAFSPTLWSQAVIAEVYPLHSTFVAVILGGMLWLLARREAPPREQARTVAILFLLIGLSFTNHLTTALLLPAFVLTLFLVRPRLTWRQWGISAALLLLGLLLYAFIPLRWPALNDGRMMRPDEFIGWVTGQRFAGALRLDAWLHDPTRWGILWRLVVAEYGWVGLALSGFGLVVLGIRRWRAALITALVYAAYAFYVVNYYIPDIGVYFIPMYLIQALWMAAGIHAALEWFGRWMEPVVKSPPPTPTNVGAPSPAWRGRDGEGVSAHTSNPGVMFHRLRAALITGFAVIPLVLVWAGFPRFDWREETALEEWGRAVLALPLAEGSAILADSEKIAPLEYLHRIEGIRSDMQMIVLATEADYQADLRARLAAGQTVYLARYLPGLEGEFYLRSVGPLIEVSRTPLTQPPPLNGELALEWAEGIRLLGYQSEEAAAAAGGDFGLTLYWTLDEPVTHNAAVRLRLVNPEGEAAWEGQPAYAVSGRYPTAAWEPGEIIPDYHALALPYALSPGSYTLEVALAPLFGGAPVPLTDGATWAPVMAVAVTAPTRPPADFRQQTAMALPGWALMASAIPESAPGGGAATVTLTWRAAPSAGPLAAALEGGAESAPITLSAPDGGGYVQSVHRIEIPAGDGVAWQLQADGLRCGWLRPRTGACALGTTAIAGEAAAEAIANFDNLILLTGLEMDRDRLRPGETLGVTLTWQSLQAITEDYTVFVHLLGPDGQLHGQVDAWPVQGSYPTSAWTPGETIVDRYQVRLDGDAPAGSYQAEIGFYLLATNTRLPIVSAAGDPLDDKVLVGGLIVDAPSAGYSPSP